VDDRLARELAPDELRRIVEPLIPPQRAAAGRGTRQVQRRTVFTAVVHVLTTGCAWRHLPSSFGVSRATAHRRFTASTNAGV
jgi:transposase